MVYTAKIQNNPNILNIRIAQFIKYFLFVAEADKQHAYLLFAAEALKVLQGGGGHRGGDNENNWRIGDYVEYVEFGENGYYGCLERRGLRPLRSRLLHAPTCRRGFPGGWRAC